MKYWSIGVDVGGTFTDFYAVDVSTGTGRLLKLPSTPADPSDAIVTGIFQLLSDGDRLVELKHGTTVALNSLLEKKGSTVALVTTKGFKDLIEIGRQVRPDMYDLQRDMPAPLVERHRRLELSERVMASGQVLTDPSDEEIERVLDQVEASDAQACAVCFLFSFVNPRNEQRFAERLAARFPGMPISVSSEVNPEFREFERFSTTVLNAYVQPVTARYLTSLRTQVEKIAPSAPIFISQSSGGLMSIRRATRFPIRTALSGPSAGVVGASAVARQTGYPDVITLDMGGTSADVCLIREGKAQTAVGRHVGEFPIRLPMVDIHTIGAGGGSIVWFDSDGLLKVGPESAGAVPGPACYGTGGTRATVSDANLVLGRLSSRGLLGGGMPLDSAAARRVFEPLAEQMGMTVENVALGVLEIVVSNMVRAIRSISVERGHDPKDFALMAFGGAGPLHAADVARSLGIARAIIPPSPGILCAQGLLSCDLTEEFAASARLSLEQTSIAPIRQTLGKLRDAALQWFAEEGISAERQALNIALDMRYVGQNFELHVPLARMAQVDHALNLPELDTLRRMFFAEHERAYGYFNPNDMVEVVNYRVTAVARSIDYAVKDGALAASAVQPAAHYRRGVCYPGDVTVETPVFDRSQLHPGHRVMGPAIVEQLDTTVVVFPGDAISVAEDASLIMELN